MSLATADVSSLFVWDVAIFILLAGVSLLIGYVLAKNVRGKHMAIGSAVYWAVYLINLYFVYYFSYNYEGLRQIYPIYALSGLIYFSGYLMLFLDLAYAITWYRLKHHVFPNRSTHRNLQL